MKILSRLCLAGNTISVATLVLVLSVMNGFNKVQQERLLSGEPHLTVYFSVSKPPIKSQNLEALTSAAGWSFNDIKKYNYFEQQDVVVRTLDGAFSGAVAKGFDSESLLYLLSQKNSSRLLNEIQDAHNTVFVGHELASQLGLFEGDEITLVAPEALLLPRNEVVQVEKVIVGGLFNSGLSQWDGQAILYNKEKSLLRLKKTASFENGIDLYFNNPHRAEKFSQNLKEKGFKSASWMEKNSSLFFALKMEKYSITSFLILTLLVTSFTIISVIVMLITQKRREIGLLMALGSSPAKTKNLFLSLGFGLSASGMFLGLVIGLTLALALQWFKIPLLPDIYLDPYIPIKIDFKQMSTILVILFSIAFFAAWLPVKMYLKTSPSDVLRNSAN